MIPLPVNAAAAKAHFLSLQKHIERRIDYILRNGVRKDGNTIRPYPRLRTFLRDLKGPFLEQIITADPVTFPAIINQVIGEIPNASTSGSSAYLILYNLFIDSTYENAVFDKLNFIRTIAIDTCPYCNRAYIYALDRKKKIKPELDHFFPKTIYPFLGVAFYNLIPSCQTCNGLEAKSQSDPLKVGLRNPYLVKYTDFKFSFKVVSPTITSSRLDENSIKIILKKSVRGNVNVFKLKDAYQFHRNHVIELIVKQKVKYPDSYKAELVKFGLTPDEIDRMILGNYAKEIEVHKRPLAKLYQDIGKELKLIK